MALKAAAVNLKGKAEVEGHDTVNGYSLAQGEGLNLKGKADAGSR